jgi:hypothetical protein
VATDDVTDEDEIGFRPTFSRECEAIFNAARMGAFLTLEELRNNLRLAGMWLGPDQIEAPDFEVPDPPDEEDVDTDMEGDE